MRSKEFFISAAMCFLTVVLYTTAASATASPIEGNGARSSVGQTLAGNGYSDPSPYVQGQRVYGPTPPCGIEGQIACDWFVYDQVQGMNRQSQFFCGKDGLMLKNLIPYPTDDGICTKITPTGLDMTRLGPNCGPNTNRSCWADDDTVRDNLSFATDALGFVTHLSPGMTLSDGRYIYVYLHTSDGAIILRKYDRADDGGRSTCASYAQFRAEANSRASTDPGVDEPTTTYLHVRHSQLAGSTTALVWAAGELRVTNGKIDRVNNGSGHFKPSEASTKFLIKELRSRKIALADDLQFGSYTSVSAAEATCPPLPTAPITPADDDDQELKDDL